MKYCVKRIQDKSQIGQCERFTINQYMWNSTQEPKVYGWMGYVEGQGLFVKMVCEEKDPKRVYQHPQDPVYMDSTMEAFLAFLDAGEVLSNDCMYTNFEINSNGAMLANYGKGRHGRQPITEEQYQMTGVNAVIEEERWSLEVLFPEAYLKQLTDFEAVKAGKPFYCNFYKISESEEILHFGSYSPIESEKPNFHLPVCFAEAVIE
ncbi:MAG: carbohydrate-binding family 9-like protein [Faecalimonas sp.]|nr:carbohydrate-binding family 9-like protein [Faecalimonas sp.]